MKSLGASQAPGRHLLHERPGREKFFFSSRGGGQHLVVTRQAAAPRTLRTIPDVRFHTSPSWAAASTTVVCRPYDRRRHWPPPGAGAGEQRRSIAYPLETYPLDSHPGFRREGLLFLASLVSALPPGARRFTPSSPQGLAPSAVSSVDGPIPPWHLGVLWSSAENYYHLIYYF